MLKTVLCATLAVAAMASCTKEGAGLADPKTNPVEDTSNRLDTSKPGAHDLTGSGTVEQRLARLEKRVSTITKILEQALPPAEPDPSKTYAATIDPLDPVEGPADAKIT